MSQALHSLSACMEDTLAWMQQNMLKLNCDKTEWARCVNDHSYNGLWLTALSLSRGSVPSIQLRLQGVSGVEFDATLKMDRQVSAMCKGLHYHLSNIARIRPYISKEACEHACRAVALSRLEIMQTLCDFGASNSVKFSGCHDVVQNRAAKLIFNARNARSYHTLAPTSPLAPSQKYAYCRKILTITYKCLHNHSPNLSQRSSLILTTLQGPGLRSCRQIAQFFMYPERYTVTDDNAFQSGCDLAFGINSPETSGLQHLWKFSRNF